MVETHIRDDGGALWERRVAGDGAARVGFVEGAGGWVGVQVLVVLGCGFDGPEEIVGTVVNYFCCEAVGVALVVVECLLVVGDLGYLAVGRGKRVDDSGHEALVRLLGDFHRGLFLADDDGGHHVWNQRASVEPLAYPAVEEVNLHFPGWRNVARIVGWECCVIKGADHGARRFRVSVRTQQDLHYFVCMDRIVGNIDVVSTLPP